MGTLGLNPGPALTYHSHYYFHQNPPLDSYGIGFFFIALMALRFFAWFRHGRELIVISYGLTMCIFIAFLGTSIIYALYEFSTSIYPKLTSKDIAVQVSGKNPYPNFYDTYFYYTYLSDFYFNIPHHNIFVKSAPKKDETCGFHSIIEYSIDIFSNNKSAILPRVFYQFNCILSKFLWYAVHYSFQRYWSTGRSSV